MPLPSGIPWKSYMPSFQGNIAFLVCLLLSVSVWLSIKLSQTYHVERSTKVSYAIPAGYIINPLPTDNLIVQYSASGWNLFSQSFLSPKNSNVDITPLAESGTQLITTSDLYNIIKIKEEFKDALVSEIFPDVISFEMIKQVVKKVPVNVTLSFTPTPGNILKRPFFIEPDSIDIQGPYELIDTIKSWPTIKLEDVKIVDRWSNRISLCHDDNILLSTKSVQLSVEAEQHTQKRFLIPLQALAKNYQVIPDQIEVSFSIGISRFEYIDSSLFSFSVESNEHLDSTSIFPVILVSHPKNILNIQYQPKTVSYVPSIEKH